MAERFNTSENAKRLGQRLRKARKNKGLKSLQVTKKVHVHHGHISRIERGQMTTLGKSVQKLCKFLDVQPVLGSSVVTGSHLGARINALVNVMPANEPAITRLIDALEELINVHA